MSEHKRISDIFARCIEDNSIESLRYLCENAIAAENSGEWHGLHIDKEWSFGYDEYRDCEIVIRGQRWETDKEYDKRLKQQKRLKERSEKDKIEKLENERKEYQRLKKKFEKENK